MRTKTSVSLFSLLLFFSFAVTAQQKNITIKILGPKNESVAHATITVTNRFDSLQRYTQTADSTGTAVFTLSADAQYIASVSAINYTATEKGFRTTNNQVLFRFVLQPETQTMEGVTVTAAKPLMRQEDDKTIVDPESLAATSTSGYEVIEKTPGLFVDQDGNIYLSSTTPATVYINGREMRMSTADIASMLKSLPPNSISKIEILRTPSAKYDASGSGGIVNVVLKKGVRIGLTGSVNAGFQQGVYGNQYAGISLNNNTGKTTSYINLNYSRRNSFEDIVTNRNFAPDSLLSQDARTVYPGSNVYLGYGISKELTKKWEIGYDGRGSLNFSDNKTDNLSDIRKISTGALSSTSLGEVWNEGKNSFLNQGFTAKYKIDSLGSEWTHDISYNYSVNKTDQSFRTSNLLSSSSPLLGDGDIGNHRHFVSAQTDLKWKLPKRITLESGLKSTFMYFKSNTAFTRTAGGVTVKDDFRTNRYNYRENINAAYVQASKTFGKDVILKTGVRLENTNMNGNQLIPYDTSFQLRRTDPFPYVYLSKNLMKIAGYDLRAYLVYRRTISRPAYEYLNPFPRFIDQYLFETGNPSLRPQFTQNIEANISVDERPILAVGKNYTTDIFTNVIYQVNDSSSLAYRTYDNLGKNTETYFRALGAVPPGGRYFIVAGAQYNHNFYQGQYDGKPLSFKRGSWVFFTYQTLKIDKHSQLVLNGFLRLKGQLQFYELQSFGMLNMSVNRQFMKRKLTVTLSANDIFLTNRTEFTLKQGVVDAFGTRRADTRRFGINLRYNFGLRKRDDNGPNMFTVNPDGN